MDRRDFLKKMRKVLKGLTVAVAAGGFLGKTLGVLSPGEVHAQEGKARSDADKTPKDVDSIDLSSADFDPDALLDGLMEVDTEGTARIKEEGRKFRAEQERLQAEQERLQAEARKRGAEARKRGAEARKRGARAEAEGIAAFEAAAKKISQ